MYLTAAQIKTRLTERYGVTDPAIDDGDALAASEALRALAPFTLEVDLDATPPELPDALLDWVALKALALATDEAGPITAEGMGRSSTSYALPEHSRNGKRARLLILPYLAWKGARA